MAVGYSFEDFNMGLLVVHSVLKVFVKRCNYKKCFLILQEKSDFYHKNTI